MSATLRFQVLGAAFRKKAIPVPNPATRPSQFFAQNVVTRQKMSQYLPSDIYAKMCDVIDNGTKLDLATADAVAAGMKKWAMELGATHCTHWFQPLTEGTAEKHDGFVEHDGHGGMVEEFTGRQLVQQEPDASSFPNGGIRSTFEARGYTAWDPASPVFVIGDTLHIPTIFISYTGEALDYKTPLKKSLQAVDRAATAVSRYFYPDVRRVISNLGWEQEYFLVDEGLYSARPDLLMTGRTLMGHDSAKNQQMDDHYLGSIPSRVASFMKDLEIQALQLGIPCKTRHNEVAPNQFEFAPIFEETNLAVDHNMLFMGLMKSVARRHGFRCLHHEKHFAGINGSGKHNNSSLTTDTGILLHKPGTTPLDNLRFITFIVQTLMAVHRHNALLKASIISAGNAHRLGGHEAPPLIVSTFLGTQLSQVLDQLEASEDHNALTLSPRQALSLDIPQIPQLLLDNTDRNRTSPFAFTGNRFEFRAVGSQQNCAAAMIVLNTAVAQALTHFKQRVDAHIAAGMPTTKAILTILRQDIKTCRPIHFDGNGYSPQWQDEARRRGLDTQTSVPHILDRYLHPDTIQMFADMNVMTAAELQARTDIKLETYYKKIQIEARVFADLSHNHILPAAPRYQNTLIDNVSKMSQIFPPQEAHQLNAHNIRLIQAITNHCTYIARQTEAMRQARKAANTLDTPRQKAIAYHDTVAPLLQDIRYHVDKLELIVDDQLWPLPKYRELLFIH